MNKAQPPAGLLAPGSAAEQLAFQGRPWSKLCSYLQRVSAAAREPLPQGAQQALARLRAAVERFGSPGTLRERLRQNPELLRAKAPPDPGYIGLVWLAQSLHDDAQALASGLASLAGKSDSSGLRALAEHAAAAMPRSGSVRAGLTELRAELLAAHAALAAEIPGLALQLQELQVQSGRLAAELESIEAAIAKESWLTPRKKKAELEQRLEHARASAGSTSARARELQAALATLEAIADDGNWLAAALDDLAAFLEAHRTAWRTVSSGLTELATRASSEQLADEGWLRHALGGAPALEQWSAIARAAQSFVAHAAS
jgi:DNA repair exonuclease SbcCD ATPase subunit